MKKTKISIIVPNYNAEKYIDRCLDSIINQKFDSFEIIVVDDGSTDRSISIVTGYCKKYSAIKLIKQENMNASIARNRGMEYANGEYLLFLDSDDVLFPNALSRMLSIIESDKSDLVIGNFQKINENGDVIQDCNVVKEDSIIYESMNICGLVPNPSNKLFKRSIIDKNGIAWGNVRIGQDLNFFLKYLVSCNKISLMKKNIYGWRTVKNSISSTYSFRIFDIYESFQDIKKFYKKHGAENLYDEYIRAVEFRHYYLQMEKQKNFIDKSARRIIIRHFEFLIRQIEVKKCRNFNDIKSDYIKCKIKLSLKPLYSTSLYTWADKKFARK